MTQLITPEQLKTLRYILDMTQTELAKVLNVSLATIKSWEQDPESSGYRKPSGAALGSLTLILSEWLIFRRSQNGLPVSSDDRRTEHLSTLFNISQDIIKGYITVDDALKGISYYQQRVLCIYRVYIEDDILHIQNRKYCPLGKDDNAGTTKFELAPNQSLPFEYTFDDGCPPWNGSDAREMYQQKIQIILDLKLRLPNLTVRQILEQTNIKDKPKYLS